MSQLHLPTEAVPFTIVADVSECLLEFKCYERVSLPGEPLEYHVKEWSDGLDWTGDLERAQVFLSGHIKWDGCANVWFDEQDHASLHFCGLEDARKVGALIEHLYALAQSLIPGWDEKLAK